VIVLRRITDAEAYWNDIQKMHAGAAAVRSCEIAACLEDKLVMANYHVLDCDYWPVGPPVRVGCQAGKLTAPMS